MTGITFERKVSMGTVLSAIVQIIILIAFIAGLNYRVDSAQSDINSLKSREAITSDSLATVRDRVATVEINQRNTADRSAQFQADTKAILSKLQDQNLAILQQVAALNATLKGGGEAVR